MNRVRDYGNFAVWFVGLGYMALWPLCSPDANGRPFGASLFCHDVAGVLNLLCNSEHPLRLPAGLQMLGLLSAVFVVLRLLVRAARRSRRAAVTPSVDISALLARLPATSPPPPCRKRPARPQHPVRPRSQFGLRGAPR